MRRAFKVIGWVVLGLLVAVLALAAWLMRPFGANELTSKPSPAADYAEAVRRIDEVKSAETTMALQPVGRSYAWLHGSETATAVVIFHGYTDVADQFSKLAKGYYDAGYNVWVPRMPYHGYTDRMTGDLSKLTPEVFRQTVDENVDIGAGLGRSVEVVGLSGGGALSTWAAAERPEVGRSVIISPLILPKGWKPWMVLPVARLSTLLPDSYTWWTDQQEKSPPPEYPRYSRRGITSYLLMAQRARADGSGGRKPINGDVVVISNLSDEHLDTQYPIDMLRPLVADGSSMRTVVIPASEGLKHDIIGVVGDNGPRIRNAYRYLEQALGIPLPDPLAQSGANQ